MAQLNGVLTEAGNVFLKNAFLNGSIPSDFEGLHFGMMQSSGASSEVAYQGYGRVKAVWDVATGKPTANTNIVNFNRPPNGFTPVAVSYVGLFSKPVGGELYWAIPLQYDGSQVAITLSHSSFLEPTSGLVEIDFQNLLTKTCS